ncbi:hypothetical protein SAY87_006787 [Trapa incisa]|uniref:DEP domain-containing protein n=1 Tax=Trapa incisa TaxID=236973 RepID=A0AAN7JXH0_9MYRT|nr:hypothetical protein SAY87_006787 [Trapa incisa]
MELMANGNHQDAVAKLTGEEDLPLTGERNCDKPTGKVSDCGVRDDGFLEVVFSVEKQEGDEMSGVPTPDNRPEGERETVATVDSPKAVIEQQKIAVIQPHSLLPKPEAPPGFLTAPQTEDFAAMNRSKSLTESLVMDMPAIGKFIKDRSNSFSAAIVRRLSSLTDSTDDYEYDDDIDSSPDVTEINLSGLKVIVKMKPEPEKALKGTISFFSRSNCRDCRAVRNFFRERGLIFVEINVDVYPLREKELVARTGSSQVPAIFFNEKQLGGLVALNSLRNSGLLERRMDEMLAQKCPPDAPAPPVYGFDDPEETAKDGLVAVVRVLRQRLPIQDRLMKMKIVKNCFAGAEMVEVLIHHFDCGRKKAVEIGKQLAKKHFIHHVSGDHDFEDGNNFYRFLEHAPFIPRCFNFRGTTNDNEPKPAALVGSRITKIMAAILESYSSDDRQHLNYAAISKSEEFRRYVNLSQELHRVDLTALSQDERLAFFLNLYNAMVIHAVIRVGLPEGIIDRRSFYSDFQYVVGGRPYSLTNIVNGILRNNRRAPYSLVKPFSNGDPRLELALPKVNPLIHFGLCNGTRSSPTVRFFSPGGVESELRCAAREFFQSDAISVELDKRTVKLTPIIKWFSSDFGNDKEILRWIINYLDATKAGLLMHLLGDGGPVSIVYRDYDWSVNS